MPRQKMEALANLGGRFLNQLREELKKFPDEVLVNEDCVSDEFNPDALPIFLVKGGDLVGAVGVEDKTTLRNILIPALLNDVGLVRVREDVGKRTRAERIVFPDLDGLIERAQRVHLGTLATGGTEVTLNTLVDTLGRHDCANCGEAAYQGEVDWWEDAGGDRHYFCTWQCREEYINMEEEED